MCVLVGSKPSWGPDEPHVSHTRRQTLSELPDDPRAARQKIHSSQTVLHINQENLKTYCYHLEERMLAGG